MKAIDFLKWQRDGEFHCCPQSREGNLVGLPSNGELRRWLNNGAVLVNGSRPKPGDEIVWPIWQLIYFQGTESRVTILNEETET